MYGAKETFRMCCQRLVRWICTSRRIQQLIALRILAQVKTVTKEICLVSVFESDIQGIQVSEFLLKAYLEGIQSFSGLTAHVPVESISELVPFGRFVHED